MRFASRLAIAALGAALPLAIGLGCSEKKTGTSPGGGPVSGAVDDHCTKPTIKAQRTDQASCHPDAGGDSGPDAKGDTLETSTDGGDTDPVDGGDNPYGPTMFNSVGDDDDCKYHVKWSVTATRVNEDVTFTVTVTTTVDCKPDCKPATGAAPYIEATLDDIYSAPPTAQKATEISPGTYTIAPIRFDRPGNWLVRFHFYSVCVDLYPDSPHGHAAFYVSVP